MSRPQDIGTRAETAVVRYLDRRGVEAHRIALAGVLDRGDVHADAGRMVVEVKSRKRPPTLAEIDAWMVEVHTEAMRVPTADIAVLVVKRPGSAKPEQWGAFVYCADLAYLLTGRVVPCPEVAVGMTFAEFVTIYRQKRGHQ